MQGVGGSRSENLDTSGTKAEDVDRRALGEPSNASGYPSPLTLCHHILNTFTAMQPSRRRELSQLVVWVMVLVVLESMSTLVQAFVVVIRPPQQQQRHHLSTTSLATQASSSSGGETQHARKMDKRWQKKRRRVELGPDGLPSQPIHAPRQISKMGGSQSKRSSKTQGKAWDAAAVGTTGGASRLRIIGGSARGKKLESPPVHLRPMMSKVREALFSTLFSFDLFAGNKPPRVLDLFCGAGSVGLEALSRGAAEAVFVDLAPECCECVEQNLKWCNFEAGKKGKAVRARAEEALRTPERLGIMGTFDLVSITPPYEEVVYADLIRDVMESPAVTEDTLVVIEYPVELGSLPFNIGEGRLLGLRNRRYGRTVLAIYAVRPTGKRSGDLRPQEFDFAPQAIAPKRDEKQEQVKEDGI